MCFVNILIDSAYIEIRRNGAGENKNEFYRREVYFMNKIKIADPK